jgi:hypothetical protein
VTPSHRVRLAAAALATALILPSMAVGEQARAKLALVTIAGSQAQRDEADRLAEQLARALAPEPVVPPAAAREKLLRAGGQEALRSAARRAGEARRSLEAFADLAATARLLREASDAHLDLLPLLGQIDEPVELLVDLATVELAQGHQKQVDEALESAARLDPSFDLDPQEVSPRLALAARKARGSADDGPILSVARARRIGQKLAVESVLLVQPRPGPQQVLIERYRTATGAREQAWTVKRGDLSRVVAALGVAPAPTPAPAPAPAPPPTRDDVGAGSDATAAEVEAPVEEGASVVFSPGEPSGVVEPPERPPWYRRWWVWTIVGAVVAAGGATGLVLGLRAQQEQTQTDLTLEVHGHW